jgi:cell division protein FtsB
MANNSFQAIKEQIPAPLRNKYFLVLTLFFAWMIFLDRHDLVTQWRLQKTVDKLEADKAFYSEKIEEAEQERLDLDINDEKFAREQYYMKKSDEDVFIIVEKED